MKFFLTLFGIAILGLILCVSLALSQDQVARMSLSIVAGGSGVTADTTPPTLSTFSVGTDGLTWTFTYSDVGNITATNDGDMCDGYTVTMSTAGALTFTYAGGTRGSTKVFTCTGSAEVVNGETITDGLNYTQGTITDTAASPNALDTITDKTTGFTNNVPAACADPNCTGFLLCQNLEGTGYDNSESWTTYAGTPNADYTTTILRGSQSLLLNSAAIYNASAFNQAEFYFFFRLQVGTFNSVKILDIRDSGYASIGRIETVAGTPNKLIFYHGTAYIEGTYELSTATPYYIWGRYKAGSGANGLYDIWVNNSRSYSGATHTITGTDGTSTANAAYIFPEGGGNYVFDQLLLKATSIGEVCE